MGMASWCTYLRLLVVLLSATNVTVSARTWTEKFVEQIEESLLEYSGYDNSTWEGEQTRKLFTKTERDPIVKLAILDRNVVMDNGFVRVNLTKPDGIVSEIYYYNSKVNLLELIENDGGGYWDIVWGEPNDFGRTGRENFDIIKGTEFSVIKQDGNQIELSFKKTWDPPRGQGLVPLNIDKRFIMLRGSHGFYSYEILEHLQGWPAFTIVALRLALKLNGDKFHYMAISDEVRRVMPTSEDRRTGRTLDYPEAVLLTNPSNPELKGEVDDKYQYSVEAEDSHVHGWISDELNLGLWMITSSNEFRNGGPNKRELTSHVGPTTLAVFLADHYLGENAKVKVSNGEPWKKVLGPVFVYLNRAIGVPDPRDRLWDNAKMQMRTELQSWPYSFPLSEDFPHSDQRGSVSGRLLVHDRFVNKESTPANSAYVGLAQPGVAGSWQTEGKGYQFWTRTNADGIFLINNVCKGKYSLYAWVPGFIGEFKYEVDLDITPGHQINLGGIVYEPPRDGPTLWEIGIPDRSAAEFYIPDPSPNYINKAFLAHDRRKASHPVDKFKQYGLWERYTELYPDHDLVYNVGASDYNKDWFYAQVTRKNKDNAFHPTTWQIVFNLDRVVAVGAYKLRVALASATLADLQVRVNSPPSDPALLQTRMIGRDNAIARHGIHGVYWLYHVDIPSFCLVAGKNTIYLYQSISSGPFEGVMYDYLRLEAPSEMATLMKSG